MKRDWRTIAAGILTSALTTWVCSGQEPSSQPATRAVQADPQRLNDLMVVIEGQNSAQARRTGARELLRQGWPETPERLAAVLRGSDPPAKAAVALALSDLPQFLRESYLEPLLGMLGDPEHEVQQAAGQALAAYRNGGVTPRLRALMLDEQHPRRTRLAAIEALSLMTGREAIAALAEGLADSRGPICKPALAALEQATALDFEGDVEAARAWWQQNRDVPLVEWQRVQLERLAAQNRARTQREQTLELRLAKALRDAYFRTPETEHSALLSSYLGDTLAAVRLLGLELVQSHQAEGKTLPEEIAVEVRKLLGDREWAVRAAAVQAVSSFRDAADAERFDQMLASERNDVVRQALVNGLGYVGSASAASQLLRLLEEPEAPCANEAVTALGRLAERGVLDPPLRRTVVSALLAKFRASKREQIALRARLLWAMSRVGDPRCGRVFVEALDTHEAVTVRQAAVQGIALLANPPAPPAAEEPAEPTSTPAGHEPEAILTREALADALLPATRDPDVGVRKTAVEALAGLATSDAHLQALCGRLPTDQESDESVRELAWRGMLRVLANRPAEQVESWIARLPEDGTLKARRELELLQVAEQTLSAQPGLRGELGRVRARMAAQRVALGQPDDALAAYLRALEDLRAAGSPELTRVAVELLRFALVNDRYDEQVAAALAAGNPPLDGKELWEGIRAEVEQRVKPDSVDEAIAMLVTLQARPPTSMPADVAQAIGQLLQRARDLKAKPPTPTSQPDSAPANEGG